jgi:glutathione synthase
MRLLYLMDPVGSILPDKDTTFAFMKGAQRLGHTNFHAEIADLYLAGAEVRVRARPIHVGSQAPYLEFTSGYDDLSVTELDAALIRKDPPFDQAYLYATLLLEHARGKTLIVNDPRALRDANEKLYALQFPELVPRTLVTAHQERILRFVAEVGGRAVIKPLDGAGGFGVLALTAGDHNARAIVDMLTAEGRKLAMVQEYLPAVREGDKRILLLDGEPLGAILRVPRADDLRSNIHVGGTVVPAELTREELSMVRAMGPRLRADGLFFVGLDVIGGRLTEVNVTSPTGIQQLASFTGSRPEEKVIAWIEARTQSRTARGSASP